MRMLFVAQGPSHLQWLVPLAWTAQLTGHDVLVAARNPHTGVVLRAGLPVVAAGDEDQIAALEGGVKEDFVRTVARRMHAEGRDGFAPTEEELLIAGGRKMIAIADGMADDVVDLVRAWRPDIVVHDTGALVGRLAAAAIDVPAVGHTWGTTIGGFFDVAEEHLLPYLEPMFRRYGARPQAEPVGWIDPSPPSMRPVIPVRRIDMRYTRYSGPGRVPSWVWRDGGRPRVCLTTGVSEPGGAGLHDPQTVTLVVERLRDAGAEVVLAVANAAAVPARLPGDVRVAESLPLNALLPTCAAVVHHGGVGTGTTALSLGLPQLVVHAHLVQQHWAEVVAAAGAGLSVDATSADDVAIAGAVAALLDDPKVRHGAAAVAAEMAAMPAPAAVVTQLEEISRNHGR